MTPEEAVIQFKMFAALIAGLLLLLIPIMKYWVLKPTPIRNGNGTSKEAGTQSTGYWQAEFKNIVGEGLNERIVPILDRQTDILQKMSEGIQELIIIQRNEQVRKAAAGGKK